MGNLFSVYIIESQSPSDHFDGRSEGNPLVEGLDLLGIPNRLRTVVDRENLKKALNECESMVRGGEDPPPILHVSAHGSDEGVGLTSGDFLSWGELRGLLGPINVALGFKLILCMSCCKGLSAVRMFHSLALTFSSTAFGTVVGPEFDVSYPDGLLAFLAFYHQLTKGNGLEQAVQAMCGASGERFAMATDRQALDCYLRQMLNARAIQGPNIVQ